MYYIDMSNKKVYECQYDCEAEYVKMYGTQACNQCDRVIGCLRMM